MEEKTLIVSLSMESGVRQSLFILVTALMLGGCGLSKQAQLRQQLEEGQKLYDSEVRECDRRYPDRHRKPVTPRIKCYNDAHIKFAERGDPDIDLVTAVTAQMLVIAERFDSGRLTETQFEAEKAMAFADYRTRVKQRQNSEKMANAAARQAAAARQQAWAAEQQAISASLPKTCHSIGSTVTCY